MTCVIKVDGVPLSTSTVTGGFNIADGEIGQDPITNLWEDTQHRLTRPRFKEPRHRSALVPGSVMSRADFRALSWNLDTGPAW